MFHELITDMLGMKSRLEMPKQSNVSFLVLLKIQRQLCLQNQNSVAECWAAYF